MKKFPLLILMLTLFFTGWTQTVINTYVGNGFIGQILVNGQSATSAECYPMAAAFDQDSNLYYIDGLTMTVVEVNHTTLVANTIAGYFPGSGQRTGGYAGDGGPATLALFQTPSGIATDDSANVYIADMFNNRVRKIYASSGVIVTIAGNGTAGFSGDSAAATSAELSSPYSVAVDDTGNVYINDLGNYRIRKINVHNQKIYTIAGNGTSGFKDTLALFSEFGYPQAITVDDSLNLYISDATNNRIRKFNYVSGRVSTCAGNGTQGFTGDGGAATSAELSIPTGVAVDDSANIFIADQQNNRVRKVEKSNGHITTIAGTGSAFNAGDGGLPTSAALFLPYAVACNPNNGYVAVCVNGYRIRLFNHY